MMKDEYPPYEIHPSAFIAHNLELGSISDGNGQQRVERPDDKNSMVSLDHLHAQKPQTDCAQSWVNKAQSDSRATRHGINAWHGQEGSALVANHRIGAVCLRPELRQSEISNLKS
jgi:hypothetical protein